MKRLLCIFLCAFLLSGCGNAAKKEGSTVFYYCRSDYVYGDIHGVIAPEHREVSQQASDLKSTLALYLVGPLEESLTSPFIGAKLVSVDAQNDMLQIRLADADKAMTDADFTLAAACLAKTSLELTQLPQVTIICGEHSATMDENNLLLYDSITSTEITPEDTQ